MEWSPWSWETRFGPIPASLLLDSGYYRPFQASCVLPSHIGVHDRRQWVQGCFWPSLLPIRTRKSLLHVGTEFFSAFHILIVPLFYPATSSACGLPCRSGILNGLYIQSMYLKRCPGMNWSFASRDSDFKQKSTAFCKSREPVAPKIAPLISERYNAVQSLPMSCSKAFFALPVVITERMGFPSINCAQTMPRFLSRDLCCWASHSSCAVTLNICRLDVVDEAPEPVSMTRPSQQSLSNQGVSHSNKAHSDKP